MARYLISRAPTPDDVDRLTAGDQLSVHTDPDRPGHESVIVVDCRPWDGSGGSRYAVTEHDPATAADDGHDDGRLLVLTDGHRIAYWHAANAYEIYWQNH